MGCQKAATGTNGMVGEDSSLPDTNQQPVAGRKAKPNDGTVMSIADFQKQWAGGQTGTPTTYPGHPLLSFSKRWHFWYVSHLRGDVAENHKAIVMVTAMKDGKVMCQQARRYQSSRDIEGNLSVGLPPFKGGLDSAQVKIKLGNGTKAEYSLKPVSE
jgi:hypothetical protein